MSFGSLERVPLRVAWSHEAQEFTPWLAENIGKLSAAIGVPLEVIGAEVAVETFVADLLARNQSDRSIVLIENQLGGSDHGHLGQIMTYLAGLGAHTVVWIAANFKQPHLSAIRCLNTHTAALIAFFAVRLDVVRIGSSPFAPTFEVLERPNDWDRTLQQVAQESSGLDATGSAMIEFWSRFLARHPKEVDDHARLVNAVAGARLCRAASSSRSRCLIKRSGCSFAGATGCPSRTWSNGSCHFTIS